MVWPDDDSEGSGLIVCHCNHLTNFAVIVVSVIHPILLVLVMKCRKTKLGQISMVPRESNTIYSVKINYRGPKT